MNYTDLDLNARINLKGTYESFLKIAVERFQKELNTKLYNTRKRKNLKRTRNLYNSFGRQFVMSGSGLDILKIDFHLYGRFIDMGVGRGSDTNSAQLRKRYSIFRTALPRKPIKWYSKRKTAEEKRLAEILAQRYGMGLIQMAETLLNNTVTVQL